MLNSPTIKDAAQVSSDNKDVPVAVMAKNHAGAIYLFVVGMRDGKTNAKFTVRFLKGQRTVEVLGENRTIASKNSIFQDSFDAWEVHLYRIEDKNAVALSKS